MTPRRPSKAAVDACAKAGGGTVLLPPGKYTSGTIHLRSHVRLSIDGGAVLYASTNPAAFDKSSLLYAEDAENITIEGRGTVDGQAAYEWQTNEAALRRHRNQPNPRASQRGCKRKSG